MMDRWNLPTIYIKNIIINKLATLIWPNTMQAAEEIMLLLKILLQCQKATKCANVPYGVVYMAYCNLYIHIYVEGPHA